MRIVQKIPHPYLSVHVFAFNDNYLLKIQLGPFEQVMRFPMEAISDPSEFEMIFENEVWMEKVKSNFMYLKTVQEDFLASLEERRNLS